MSVSHKVSNNSLIQGQTSCFVQPDINLNCSVKLFMFPLHYKGWNLEYQFCKVKEFEEVKWCHLKVHGAKVYTATEPCYWYLSIDTAAG